MNISTLQKNMNIKTSILFILLFLGSISIAYAQSNVRGNALSFAGVTQSALTTSVATTATTNITIEGWFNFNSTGGGGAICIFYNGNNFVDGYGLYLLSNKIHALFGGVTLVDTGVTPALNMWMHLALVHNGTHWTVYQNGIQIITAFSVSAIAPTVNFRVGSNVGGSAEFLNGQVDEVRFWNTARSQTQIRENMHLTLAGTPSNLLNYYQFNEVSGVAIDGISANNLTLSNVVRVASTLSVGGGAGKVVSVSSVGAGSEIDLTTTNLEVDFSGSSANPNGEIGIYHITAEKPYNPTSAVVNTFDGYWVVHNFGTNAGLSFDNIKAKILPFNTIQSADITTPSNLKLYTRINNSGTSTWTQIGSANSADNATKEINFSSPSNTFLGEFVVGTNTASPAFITTWKTTTNTLTIPTFTGETYNYNLVWTNLTNAGVGNGSATNLTGAYTITGLTNNDTYKVEITGTFPRIYFSFGAERLKIQTIEQWGNIVWSSMNSAFSGCENLAYNATDAPNLTNVTDMSYMFGFCSVFNGNIGSWNTANVTNMPGLFTQCLAFNQNIGSWNTANVIDMFAMFYNADAFNQNISGWNVSNVIDMGYMFYSADAFNQNINAWTTSSVTSMANMFEGAINFNQPVINWNVSNVTDMTYMFRAANAFNQPLSTGMFTGWNTANVTSMNGMFFGATNFNQNIGGLNISNVTDMAFMLTNCGMTTLNYDNTLIGFQFQATNFSVKPNINLGANNLKYCQGANARNALTLTKGWTFTGDVLACPFITTWITSTNTITIPTTGTGYNYNITWENSSNIGVGNGSATGVTGNYTITGLTNGDSYQIYITGNFPRIFFNLGAEAPKLRAILDWGSIAWSSMASAFAGCNNLTLIPLTSPNLSGVTDMSGMFRGASQFNESVSSWNVSNVTNMSKLFEGATQFNQSLASWNVSNVTNMSSMFSAATTFNQNISSWNVSNVTDMSYMFAGFAMNHNFNQNISGWNVSNVTNMEGMFWRCIFNQNISSWNVANVTNMSNMFFNNAHFNQNISGWNVGNVTNMANMFSGATNFNQNISGWNVANVTNMYAMFNNASSFNQNVGSWVVSNVTDMTDIFNNTNISPSNYDAILLGFATISLQSNVVVGAVGRTYCISFAVRFTLMTAKSWLFVGDNLFCPSAITLSTNAISGFVTDVSNNSASQSFTISGSSLVASVTLALSTTNWEMSTDNTNFSNTLTLAQNLGTLVGQPVTIFVRLKSGASVGSISATLTASSLNATSQNITLNGTVIQATPQGIRGNMVSLDGVDDFISFSAPLTTATGNFTFEGWFYLGSNTNTTLLSNGNGNGFYLYIESNEYKIYVTSIGVYPTGVAPIVGEWAHIALVHEGTAWRLFQNGVQVYVQGAVPVNTPSTTFAVGLPILLGSYTHLKIDELRVWETARTLGEIRDNMHLTLKGNETGLKSYYQFNETSGNALDKINAQDMSLMGGATYTASTVSVAGGTSSRFFVGTTGNYNFTNTNCSLDFSGTLPNGDIVVNRLEGSPSGTALSGNSQYSRYYWVINNYGVNTGLTVTPTFILGANMVSTDDAATPSNLRLHKRTTNSNGSWAQVTGTSANATTGTVTFNSINSFSEFGVGTGGNSPLPITLLGLKGRRVEGQNGEMTEEVRLTWETASEVNNKGFEVEMSTNGLAYQKAAFVEGKGNSANIYHVSFINAFDAYYRLKQVDFDGDFSYSPVVFVEGVAGKVQVYPNPNNGTFTVSPLTPKGGMPIRILNAQGVEVPFTIEGNKITISPFRGRGASPSGQGALYFLHTVVAGKVQVTKVVIER
jgi:surface protein